MLKFNRFELPVLDALPPAVPAVPTAVSKKKRAKKPKALASETGIPVSQLVEVRKGDASVHAWATFGVIFTLILSAALNGLSNAQHAPAAWAGWLMGLSVPVLVLVLSKVAGEKWRAGQKPVARLAGGAGVALLVLSVWHCAQSIALLTGSPVFLAMPMAVAVDVGLVACEVALISEPRA